MDMPQNELCTLECTQRHQCDRMLKLKVAQIFPKVAQNVAKAV